MANDLILSPERAPAIARNWSALNVRDFEDFQRSPLIPASELQDVLAELRRAVVPCTQKEAARIGELLIGSYPKHAVDDPVIYTRGIVSVLVDYPPAIAARAVDKVSRAKKFIPTRADVAEACEELMRRLNWAKWIAERTEEERERRINERAEREAAEAARKAFLDRHGGKSPLEVLREKGLYNDGDINETQSAALAAAAD